MKMLVASVVLLGVPSLCLAEHGIFGDAESPPCRAMEYAQLKVLTKAELTDAFCRTQKLRKVHLAELNFAKSGGGMAIGEDAASRMAREETALVAACEQMEKRIAGVYESEFKAAPACDEVPGH